MHPVLTHGAVIPIPEPRANVDRSGEMRPAQREERKRGQATFTGLFPSQWQNIDWLNQASCSSRAFGRNTAPLQRDLDKARICSFHFVAMDIVSRNSSVA